MDIQLLAIVYGAIEIIFECFAWGGILFIVSNFVRNKKKYLIICSIVIYICFVLYNYIINQYFIQLQISIGNQSFLEFIGGDIDTLFKIEPLDYPIYALQLFLGYKIFKFATKINN